MRLPAPLLRRKKNVHKYSFGHALVLAGSRSMLGAAALTSLAAMRSGAGMVTLGVPRSLNLAAQKKISPVVITLPLPETDRQGLALSAFRTLEKQPERWDVAALGPGLSRHPSTVELVRRLISRMPVPLVIDADALFAVAKDPDCLLKSGTAKILTPHTGEMSRLTGKTKAAIEKDRRRISERFAKEHRCVLVLKGPRTLVAAEGHRTFINRTGNAGLATAGSGDVLTGMIAAFLAQGIPDFTAAKTAVYLHGLAADIAARRSVKASLIATDVIEKIPAALVQAKRHNAA